MLTTTQYEAAPSSKIQLNQELTKITADTVPGLGATMEYYPSGYACPSIYQPLENSPKKSFSYSYVPLLQKERSTTLQEQIIYTPTPPKLSKHSSQVSGAIKHMESPSVIPEEKANTTVQRNEDNTNLNTERHSFDSPLADDSPYISLVDTTHALPMAQLSKKRRSIMVAEQPNSAMLNLLQSFATLEPINRDKLGHVAVDPPKQRTLSPKLADMMQRLAVTSYDSSPYGDTNRSLFTKLSVEYCLKRRAQQVDKLHDSMLPLHDLEVTGFDNTFFCLTCTEELLSDVLSIAVEPIAVPPSLDMVARMLSIITPILRTVFDPYILKGPLSVGRDNVPRQRLQQ